MNQTQFVRAVYARQKKYKDERFGQAAFNYLYGIDPYMAEIIRGTDDDPYYQDDRFLRFLKRLNGEGFFTPSDSNE